MENFYSFVVPVFNRPKEVEELLGSIAKLRFPREFEVVIIEDGSSLSSEKIVNAFRDRLQISYYNKANSGPGDSRNYGMKKAKGDYFLILDSDVILPKDYLLQVDDFLKLKKIHFFGGPDAAHPSFSKVQKAISYAMTAFWTTGGIRGKKDVGESYEPRSFNMGISKEAFEASMGFGNIHPGEDPDLSLRLKKHGFSSAFIPKAVVFHKRRIDFGKFFQQVKKFGTVRPILMSWHPGSLKVSYFFPTAFSFGLIIGIVLALVGVYFLLYLYLFYFLVLFIDASIKNKSILIGALAIVASVVQFFGYGTGFCGAFFKIKILNQEPQSTYPKLFFKNVQ